MRSSEDDACCDMLGASPEPHRGEGSNREKYSASSFHGQDRKAGYIVGRVARFGSWRATDVRVVPTLVLSRAR
jgi:hypothetical protein